MIVRNIRRSMVEYHDILWDIGYAKTWEEASKKLDDLYSERPPLSDFMEWRDERVLEEIHWYGWFIDYYMEGGKIRYSIFPLCINFYFGKTYHPSYIILPFYNSQYSRINERYVHDQDHHARALVHAYATHKIQSVRTGL